MIGTNITTTVTGKTGPMNALDQTSREYWRWVLVAEGFTAIPRWAVNPAVGVAEHEEMISDDLVARLRRLADEMSLSLGSVLLTAHAKVLAALSGEMGVLTGYVAVAGGQTPCHAGSTTKPDSWRSLLWMPIEREGIVIAQRVSGQ
jgi:hypothetical protein